MGNSYKKMNLFCRSSLLVSLILLMSFSVGFSLKVLNASLASVKTSKEVETRSIEEDNDKDQGHNNAEDLENENDDDKNDYYDDNEDDYEIDFEYDDFEEDDYEDSIEFYDDESKGDGRSL